MQDDVYQSMFEVEDRHWWYTAKQRIVLHLLKQYLPSNNGARPRVADLGCGCGAMLAQLSKDFDAIGIDGSPHAIEFCAQRGVKAQLVNFTDGLSLPPGQFDAVLMLDVLEHLEDDHTAAVQAAALLRSGGIMICTAPAYQWLWSYWDDLHHHYRRYNQRQFGDLLEGAGLKLRLLNYANAALFPIAAAVRMVQKGFKPRNPKGAMHVPVAPINWALRTMYSGERHLLRHMRMPFGLSVIAVAEKP